ncbi:uncharacterized protein LY89DRAFT_681969 [Mollisia scopiformis]|uniref:Uncharacterized protein n=1 Tax=Mollisia scopiformis TaxID=149040 RepID=A0A194XMU6_MOLSC|nr:uncharacterized protein LY89DRAFT_681969 [Mollisia scopiformis]KUJ21478.1 hypothetical protein LY89DRAFT_681969 [Mollisia scopiformis]
MPLRTRRGGARDRVEDSENSKSSSSEPATPTLKSLSPGAGLTPQPRWSARIRPGDRAANASITPPTISPLSNQSLGPRSSDGEDGVEAGDIKDEDVEEGDVEDGEEADDEKSPEDTEQSSASTSSSPESEEYVESPPTQRPAKRRKIGKRTTSSSSSSSSSSSDSPVEEPIFGQLYGDRVRDPGQNRVRKVPAPSKNAKSAPQKAPQVNSGPPPPDYNKPIVFTPYFKRADFVPQPPVTGNEAWAANNVWNEESKQFEKVNLYKLRKY